MPSLILLAIVDLMLVLVSVNYIDNIIFHGSFYLKGN